MFVPIKTSDQVTLGDCGRCYSFGDFRICDSLEITHGNWKARSDTKGIDAKDAAQRDGVVVLKRPSRIAYGLSDLTALPDQTPFK